jgi:pyrimidine operon attenuation protein/uracil phosphoribosyltransferase
MKKVKKLEYGKLDITFYRDDFRQKGRHIKASSTEIDFSIENKKIILVDDVLYTGRTIQSALTALNDHGRPAQVVLLCLIDRRFNRHLPIHPNYKGIAIDALEEAYVKVEWADIDGEDRVLFYAAKQS